ncbi:MULTISPECIES: hypothetical protein [unclassified Saccharibacter]|uniref:hypothetical protein n=1 Tax=unclassified Saccharibacter TaxID=2648722 RepID=UPI00132429C2|nr:MULTISPECIES: hypothetical protein [unclassified Saccharibacter]MXV35204.1 hypothetical protein [Saccharibacter sp. EH611]MXV57249.1 hypothetical protein [Saccharibacter sp. EH70]MXV64890.1 hypothetical protein [Saccharibacter sp. EH60]
MSRVAASSMLRLAVLSVVFSGSTVGAVAFADDDGLSREAIMRQHRHLAQQNSGGDEPASESVGGESLAPPLAASDEGNGSSQGQVTKKAGGDLVTRLLERVSALEGQVRTLRGDVDQLTNQVHQDEANTSKQLSDMQFAQQGAAPRRAASVAAPAPANEERKSDNPSTAKQNLHDAALAIKAHHYDEAERLARQALKTAHSSWGKTEAQFLLAQSLAGKKAYQKAALAYYDTYSKDPQSKRAPEALLGVSGAMLALKDKNSACEALQRLKHEFPNASERVKASEKVFRARAACQ